MTSIDPATLPHSPVHAASGSDDTASSRPRITAEQFAAIEVGDLVLFDDLNPNTRRRTWILRLSEERGDIVAFQIGDPEDMPITAMRWDADRPAMGFKWHDALVGVGVVGTLTLVSSGVPRSGNEAVFRRALENPAPDGELARRVRIAVDQQGLRKVAAMIGATHAEVTLDGSGVIMRGSAPADLEVSPRAVSSLASVVKALAAAGIGEE